VYCANCNAIKPEADRFCTDCGQPLMHTVASRRPGENTSTISVSRSEDTENWEESIRAQGSAYTLPSDTAALVVVRGPNAGSRFRLQNNITSVGRHPDSDIILDDVTVSRRHANFCRSGETFTVQDAGSLNGAYVNRERVDDVRLVNGDEVQIGKFRLLFLASTATTGKHS
jgi:hypothetical protein